MDEFNKIEHDRIMQFLEAEYITNDIGPGYFKDLQTAVRNMMNNMTDLSKYDYTIILDGGHITVYQSGEKLKRVYKVKLEYDMEKHMGEVPTIDITYV